MTMKEQIITLCITYDDQEGTVTLDNIGFQQLMNCCGGISSSVTNVDVESRGPVVDKRT